MREKNILARVEEKHVLTALKELPHPEEVTQDEFRETIIEVPRLGRVCFTCHPYRWNAWRLPLGVLGRRPRQRRWSEGNKKARRMPGQENCLKFVSLIGGKKRVDSLIM